MGIQGYRWMGRVYHPECLPENDDTRHMAVEKTYTPDQIKGRKRCVYCGLSLFKREQSHHTVFQSNNKAPVGGVHHRK